jgi:hypothetical protein
MLRKLVKTTRIDLEGRSCDVRYFELRTASGGRRYTSEMVLDGSDRVILDDDTITGLESKVDRLVPAVLWSRMLAAKTSTVAA